MTEDISKKVIMVLLILVVIISILGTWVVLEATSGLTAKPVKPGTTSFIAQQSQPEGDTQSSAEVNFEVLEKEGNNG